MPEVPSDIDIARQAKMRPITEIAAELGIHETEIDPYGKDKAKVSLALLDQLRDRKPGKLILVSAITPTPAGEGKTTTSVGLADALKRIGKKAMVCLREPSLGPCFGMKGGAAGGGYAQVVPMEDINLHFTGDMHAISAAHNLLAAVIDNHMHHGNALQLDSRRIAWPRVVDMNDRALRRVVVGLGGIGNSIPRECTYDITVASEVMAILCLSESLDELKQRLGDIIVGYTRKRVPIRASELHVHGAMAALLKDALRPNLVQTLENTPAFVHGGPFANIAHGCNSIMATKIAMRLAEYTVTEAGFGADLGAEKFLNIKCRKGNIHPDAVVLVATIRALKHHGGADLKELSQPDEEALKRGMGNLLKHIENLRGFGLPVVVAVNWFQADTEAELACIRQACATLDTPVVKSNHWELGGAGAEDLARAVDQAATPGAPDFSLLYPDDLPLWEKIRTIACKIYGADDITAEAKLQRKIKKMQQEFGHLPICMAKTQYSLSSDPALKGRPSGFTVPVRDIRVSAGAGFIVALTGDIMTMPGLPRVPAAETIDINENGEITGLF